jgi:hypothetical protein
MEFHKINLEMPQFYMHPHGPTDGRNTVNQDSTGIPARRWRRIEILKERICNGRLYVEKQPEL